MKLVLKPTPKEVELLLSLQQKENRIQVVAQAISSKERVEGVVLEFVEYAGGLRVAFPRVDHLDISLRQHLYISYVDSITPRGHLHFHINNDSPTGGQ